MKEDRLVPTQTPWVKFPSSSLTSLFSLPLFFLRLHSPLPLSLITPFTPLPSSSPLHISYGLTTTTFHLNLVRIIPFCITTPSFSFLLSFLAQSFLVPYIPTLLLPKLISLPYLTLFHQFNQVYSIISVQFPFSLLLLLKCYAGHRTT